ncbi:unnamed protein product, partial [Heterosigma akashiwo]
MRFSPACNSFAASYLIRQTSCTAREFQFCTKHLSAARQLHTTMQKQKENECSIFSNLYVSEGRDEQFINELHE